MVDRLLPVLAVGNVVVVLGGARVVVDVAGVEAGEQLLPADGGDGLLERREALAVRNSDVV